MNELTDSYCERCGTRYTFGPGPAKGPSLSNARLLAKGLKNFVMTDGTSMDEAMAAARIDVTKDESTRVTEEFHRTFNFCMTCRQYACDKCWNENQGACLSCAPLWDQAPSGPENDLVIRPAVSRPDPVTPDVEMTDYARAGLQWPTADPLPAQQAARPSAPGRRAHDSTPDIPPALLAPKRQIPIGAPAERLAAELLGQEPPDLQAPIASAARVQPQPQPMPQPAQPATQQPHPPSPQPARSQLPRTSGRASEEERSAAQELQSQSQAWKSRDDGWSLWPLDGEPAGSEMTLTPEELHLVQAQLSQNPSHDEPPVAPVPQHAADQQNFATSHTLAEDAARVTAPPPIGRAEPVTAVPAAWEPEAPTPRKAASSDFDLLGSLREPIDLAQPPAGAGARRGPAIGRLLGRRASETEEPHQAAPEALTAPVAPVPPVSRPSPRPARQSKQKTAGTTPAWPAATPWVQRPIERHDWWADVDGAPGESGGPGHAAAEPEAIAPSGQTPEPAVEPEPKAPAQQPLFTALPVSTDRWAPARPDIPVPARIDRPAGEPWPTVGASWPNQPRAAAPWPVPQDTLMPASVVAAARDEHADQDEMGESPLVAALWAESAQQVQDRGSVRVCHHCALPVSTQARFCRRCGTQQA